MRFLLSVVLTTAPLLACSCVNTGSPCSAVGTSTVIFLGRVLVDSGDGLGTGPARVLIEEPLANVPKDLREVEVDTSAGTSCYYRLKAGERYVVFANKFRTPSSLSIGACSNTFELSGNEHILQALRNSVKGGPERLVGTVRRSKNSYQSDGVVPAAHVVARSNETRYEAVSDASGIYEIRGIAPGQYQIELSKEGFVPDVEYNRRWSGIFSIGPDKPEPGAVLIHKGSCTLWDLSMWPHGRISGTVRSKTGSPISGVTVQAFASDKNGQQKSSPLRVGTTDAAGRYIIEPLPGGQYLVGVNAEPFKDADPYPPTVFSQDKLSSAAMWISVVDGSDTADIDLILPPKRVGTTLRVQVLAPSGTPYSGAHVKLENLVGAERWFSKQETPADGVLELPAYLGEQYVVKALAVALDKSGRTFEQLRGIAKIEVADDHPTVVVVLGPESYR